MRGMSIVQAFRIAKKANPPTPPKPTRQVSFTEKVFWASLGVFALGRWVGIELQPVYILLAVAGVLALAGLWRKRKVGPALGEDSEFGGRDAQAMAAIYAVVSRGKKG